MRARIRTQVVLFVSAMLLFGGIVPAQYALTRSKTEEFLRERMSFLPRDDVLRPLLLGFGSTYASYLWFRTVNYYGTHTLSDRSFTWLVQMVDMVTRLNPYFLPAYEFAGLAIPDQCHDPVAGRAILERAMYYVGDKHWKSYFYYGMICFKYYGDREEASRYFLRGSRVAGEHAWKLSRLSASFLSQAGRFDEAEAVLDLAISSAENPTIRSMLEKRRQRIRSGEFRGGFDPRQR